MNYWATLSGQTITAVRAVSHSDAINGMSTITKAQYDTFVAGLTVVVVTYKTDFTTPVLVDHETRIATLEGA
jgi:hypothetical protein